MCINSSNVREKNDVLCGVCIKKKNTTNPYKKLSQTPQNAVNYWLKVWGVDPNSWKSHELEAWDLRSWPWVFELSWSWGLIWSIRAPCTLIKRKRVLWTGHVECHHYQKKFICWRLRDMSLNYNINNIRVIKTYHFILI